MIKINKKIAIAMFFLMTILLLVFFVSSASISSSQFTQPGLSSSFLRGQGVDIFPVFNEEMCKSGQDFIVQIAPFGCTPKVIRSDLLEEQNVPVFCQLSATQFNPLIDIKAIDSISFRGEYPRDVSGIGFYPARAAIKSTNRVLLNSPILENIGYAVIVLRQQPNESAMPDFVEGNLTAFLRYDIENAFGIGKATYYLPELTDQQWGEKFEQYGFWNGKGFLRTEGIDEDGAMVSIYLDKNNRFSTFRLERGQTSGNVFLPGLYCSAGLRLRLDSFENPDTRAKLNINGNIVEVADGDKFLQNECSVRDIEKQGLNQIVEISCRTDDGFERFELKIAPKIKLEIEGIEKEVGVGDFLYKTGDAAGDESVYVGYIGTNGNSNNEEDLFIYLISLPRELTFNKNNLTERELSSIAVIVDGFEASGGKTISGFLSDVGEAVLSGTVSIYKYLTKGQTYDKVSFATPKEVDDKKIEIIGFTISDNSILEKDENKELKQNYDNAMNDYRKIIDSFPSEKENPNSLKTFGEEALFQAISLSERTQQKRKALNLCQEFEERYPDSKNKPSICKNPLKKSNSKNSEFSVFINGKTKTISFEGIFEPTLEEYSAEVLVKMPDGKTTFFVFRKDQIIYLDSDKTEFIQLISFDKDLARFKVNLKTRLEVGSILKSIVTDLRRLEVGSSDGFGSNYIFSLTKINLKKVAKVSVLPNIQNTGTEANFSFKIGIEKRAIQLSPEKIKDRIDVLNDSIEKWEDVSDKLGTAVKGFNAACLTTGAVLTVKNFLYNLDGKSIARQEVMTSPGGWNDICKDEIAKTGASIDACLLDHADDIDNDVEVVYQAMQLQSQDVINEGTVENKLKEINQNLDDLEGLKNLDSNVKEALTKKGYDDGKVTLTQARDIERLSLILKSDSSYELKTLVNKKLNRILSEIKANTKYYSDRNTLINRFGISSDKVGFLELGKDAKKLPYKDLTYKDVKMDINIQGLSDDSPIAILQTSQGKQYIIVLDDSVGSENLPIKIGDEKLLIYNADDSKLITNVPFELRRGGLYFKKYDRASYENNFLNPEVKYYETEPYKGLPALVPFDKNKGWYAATKQTLSGFGNIRAFDDSGRVASFWVCNVGENGRAEFNQGSAGIGDDICQQFNPSIGQSYGTFPGLEEGESNKIVSKAQGAIEAASRAYEPGLTGFIQIGTERIRVGAPAVNVPEFQCQNFMSPKDCLLLFNVCDPVVCPSSRCDLGGTYPVADVVQSGIIGSTLLCLPNIKEGIVVPICLSGVKAGLDSWVSVQKNYRDCLKENLETGATIGICDEIHSIYLCDFFWEQAAPLSQIIIPKVFEFLTGQNTPRGGGEYLGVASAWQNAQNSVDYITQYYGARSFAAFNARAVEGIGKAVCRNFVSATYPTDIGFDDLIEPRSPPQFTAWFSETTFTTATVPPTSQYKVFYHIYAGEDSLQNIGAYYSVYLRSPSGTSFFQTSPTLTVASGYIPKGDYASETRDFTAPTGYQELCVRVNAQESCGYRKVSTEFAINYVNDLYINEQASQTNINSESECVSGTPSLYSLVNPNIQAGVSDVINPELYNQGIVRICSTDNPGKSTDPRRWSQVGTCDQGRGDIKCYIDTESVKRIIKSISIEGETLENIKKDAFERLLEAEEILSDKEFDEIISLDPENEEDRIKIINRVIDSLIQKAFLNAQKAKLLLLRGDAYAKLAIDKFLEISKKLAPLPIVEELDFAEEAEKGAEEVKTTEESRNIIEIVIETLKNGLRALGIIEREVEEPELPSPIQRNRVVDEDILKRLNVYKNVISEVSLIYSISESLIKAIIIQESEAIADKSGDSGESYGLMQIKIGAVSHVSSYYNDNAHTVLKNKFLNNDALLPSVNIKLGTAYYKVLKNTYKAQENSNSGLKRISLAAYNWGPGNIENNCKKNNKIKWENCEGIPNTVLQYISNILYYEGRLELI